MLPESALADFSAVGLFTHEPRGCVHLAGERREVDGLPHFEVRLFANLRLSDPWARAMSQLGELFFLALRANLGHNYFAAQAAVARLAHLKRKDPLDPQERGELAFLEHAPIFEDCRSARRLVRLEDLRRARSVRMVNLHDSLKLRGKAGHQDIYFLEHSQKVAFLLNRYQLPDDPGWASQQLAEALAPLVLAEEREIAHQVFFGQLTRRQQKWEFSGRGGSLTIDLGRGEIQGFGKSLSIHGLTRVDIDEEEIFGDTKFHNIFYLALADSEQRLVVYDRYVTYHERGPVQPKSICVRSGPRLYYTRFRACCNARAPGWPATTS
ncbi:MAG: hypothetical protein KC910_13700 [Candidatus Eremiobacteraeota bacterium]|nr:hypothetical protein [Candidatus Eremiobacteraeota bacterium]